MSILDLLPGRKPDNRPTTDRALTFNRTPDLSAIERLRERDVLYRLAAETARTNCPWTAAINLFGGDA